MPSRFEKFSERARKVLAIAQEEAQRFNHSYIGTEHILLGLSREPEGIASRVLEVLGIDGKRIRTAVEFIVSQDDSPKREDVGLTDRAKKVIELAVDEARKLNHHYIGTEHILIGILREGDGVAAGVLENLGASLEDVRCLLGHKCPKTTGTYVHRTDDRLIKLAKEIRLQSVAF